MLGNNLKVVVTITAKSDKIFETQSLLESLVQPSLDKPGCVSFKLQKSIDKSNEFVFLSEWESEDALKAHFETDHIKEAIARSPELLEREPEIKEFTFLG